MSQAVKKLASTATIATVVARSLHGTEHAPGAHRALPFTRHPPRKQI